jgi:hypothetical protein
MIAALAAANTLFAIGYPVRVAHANETPQLVPPSIQARGGLDAPQALQAIIPATKIADKMPGQTNRNDATGHEIANAPPDQLDPVKIAQADVLPTPSPVAPSRLLPIQEPVPAAIEASNDLPSGVHDPDALTCDAPQLVSLAKLVGWRICVQNSILATFGETGAMSPGGTVIRSSSDLAMSYKPTGEGDPDAVTCLEQQGTETRFRGPIACAHNDFWAKLNARGCTLSPNAKAIIRSETTKNLNPLACTHVPGRNGVLPPVFF